MAQVISAASSPACHQVVQFPPAFEQGVLGKLGSAVGPYGIVCPCADKVEVAEVTGVPTPRVLRRMAAHSSETALDDIDAEWLAAWFGSQWAERSPSTWSVLLGPWLRLSLGIRPDRDLARRREGPEAASLNVMVAGGEAGG